MGLCVCVTVVVWVGVCVCGWVCGLVCMCVSCCIGVCVDGKWLCGVGEYVWMLLFVVAVVEDGKKLVE